MKEFIISNKNRQITVILLFTFLVTFFHLILGIQPLEKELFLFFSFIISIYDIKYHAYPFYFWIFAYLVFLAYYPINSLTIILLIFGLIFQVKQLQMGSGDFLYLSLLSFTNSLNTIAWIVQMASLLGLLYFALIKKKEIPFIPFLTLGYLIFQCLTLFINLPF